MSAAFASESLGLDVSYKLEIERQELSDQCYNRVTKRARDAGAGGFTLYAFVGFKLIEPHYIESALAKTEYWKHKNTFLPREELFFLEAEGSTGVYINYDKIAIAQLREDLASGELEDYGLIDIEPTTLDYKTRERLYHVAESRFSELALPKIILEVSIEIFSTSVWYRPTNRFIHPTDSEFRERSIFIQKSSKVFEAFSEPVKLDFDDCFNGTMEIKTSLREPSATERHAKSLIV